MSKKRIPSRHELIESLKIARGNMAQVARVYGCSRQRVQQLVSDDLELTELVSELTDVELDNAESKLYQAIDQGAGWAVCFFLKCRGKGRGWIEKLELSGVNGLPLANIEIDLGLGLNGNDNKADQNQALLMDQSPAGFLAE